MKLSALMLVCAALVPSLVHGIVLNQIDDFESGPNGWQSGMAPGDVVTTGGPDGDEDAFLKVSATGEFGAFSKLTIFNIDQYSRTSRTIRPHLAPFRRKHYCAAQISIGSARRGLRP